MKANCPHNILMIELNETNHELLQRAASQFNLRHLQQILQQNYVRTTTDDVYDSDYLEPWVQWVSVHTGVPATEHRIQHLGDVTNLKHKQIWETLSDAGVTSGIWGVMNGERRDAKLCRFFIADPWTFDAEVYPNRLAGLTNLAAYIAKNYLDLSPIRMGGFAVEYSLSLLRYAGLRNSLRGLQLFLEGMLKFGAKNMVLAAFFEYTSAAAFANVRAVERPQFSVLFLNLIAHLQHHYWTSTEKISAELEYGFRVIDEIIKLVLAKCEPKDVVLVANGFSQQNTLHEPAWILYRPKDPQHMLRALGLDLIRVEALMTHDAHVFFSDREKRDYALETLRSATLNGQKLFLAEPDSDNERKLFYRLVFTDAVAPNARLKWNAGDRAFFELFDEVVTRTGKHIQEGFVYQSINVVEKSCRNHELYDYLLKHFASAKSPAVDKEKQLACR